MDKSTYLIILFSGQLGLLVLDLRQRSLDGLFTGTAALRKRSAAFIAATSLLYIVLQYGGLALVPTVEEVLVASQALFDDWIESGAGTQNPPLWSVIPFLVAAFYFGGLCDYLLHRFVLHNRPFWFTHENHHLPTDVAVYMPGICGRPFAVLAIFPTMVLSVLALQLALSVSGLSGVDVMPFLYVAVLLQIGIGSTTHSAYLRRCWWLHRLLKPFGLTSPQEHWLHHVSALDGNYGNFAIVWDRVFGTYLDPEVVRSRDYRAGLEYDQDFLGTLTLGQLKLPERIRRRFQLGKFCYLEADSAVERKLGTQAVKSELRYF